MASHSVTLSFYKGEQESSQNANNLPQNRLWLWKAFDPDKCDTEILRSSLSREQWQKQSTLTSTVEPPVLMHLSQMSAATQPKQNRAGVERLALCCVSAMPMPLSVYKICRILYSF